MSARHRHLRKRIQELFPDWDVHVYVDRDGNGATHVTREIKVTETFRVEDFAFDESVAEKAKDALRELMEHEL